MAPGTVPLFLVKVVWPRLPRAAHSCLTLFLHRGAHGLAKWHIVLPWKTHGEKATWFPSRLTRPARRAPGPSPGACCLPGPKGGAGHKPTRPCPRTLNTLSPVRPCSREGVCCLRDLIQMCVPSLLCLPASRDFCLPPLQPVGPSRT